MAKSQLVSGAFTKLDQEITELIRDFVALGQKLIKMRDGQVYRDGGYETFEEYCKAKAGLSITHAKQTIRNSMGWQAISGAGIPAPETQAQVEALLPMANFQTEKRKVKTADGGERTVEQTTGIKNSKALADQWGKTVREFDRLTAKAEKEGTKPPTLSSKFVRNMLPNELKVSPSRGFDCNPCVRMAGRLDKLNDDLHQGGFLKLPRLKKLLETEPPCHPAQANDLYERAEETVAKLNQLLSLIEPYTYEEDE